MDKQIGKSSRDSQRTMALVDLKEEKEESVQQLADDTGAAIIACIAPYTAVRISPIHEASASISLRDEFNMEALIEKLNEGRVKEAYLLINSPGGFLASAYKIARAFRSAMERIVTFVPHVAASGGTLVALTGNEIVMGPMSHISPLDVQISYKGSMISAATFQRFFDRASQWFVQKQAEEAPYPHKALADKLDPFWMEEASGMMYTAAKYVAEILEMAGYEKPEDIAAQLVGAFPAHSYVITEDRAKELGLNIVAPSSHPEAWEVIKNWLQKYCLQEQVTHIIRYSLPKKKGSSRKSTRKKTAKKGRRKA